MTGARQWGPTVTGMGTLAVGTRGQEGDGDTEQSPPPLGHTALTSPEFPVAFPVLWVEKRPLAL